MAISAHGPAHSSDGTPHDFKKRTLSLQGNSSRPSDLQAKPRWRHVRTLRSVAPAEDVRRTPLLATLSATDASMLRTWRSRCGNGISMPASLKALATATVTSLWSWNQVSCRSDQKRSSNLSALSPNPRKIPGRKPWAGARARLLDVIPRLLQAA